MGLATRYLQAKKTKIRAKKEKPAAQIAHLVFANAKCQNTKNQKSNFLPTLSHSYEDIYTHTMRY